MVGCLLHELLSSAKFAEVIDKLKEAFDIVLIDSPPVQLVSDSVVLSQIADTVLYVVKADSTPYPLARGGLKRLAMANAPISGVADGVEGRAPPRRLAD